MPIACKSPYTINRTTHLHPFSSIFHVETLAFQDNHGFSTSFCFPHGIPQGIAIEHPGVNAAGSIAPWGEQWRLAGRSRAWSRAVEGGGEPHKNGLLWMKWRLSVFIKIIVYHCCSLIMYHVSLFIIIYHYASMAWEVMICAKSTWFVELWPGLFGYHHQNTSLGTIPMPRILHCFGSSFSKLHRDKKS